MYRVYVFDGERDLGVNKKKMFATEKSHSFNPEICNVNRIAKYLFFSFLKQKNNCLRGSHA